jgi:hypothetical protein
MATLKKYSYQILVCLLFAGGIFAASAFGPPPGVSDKIHYETWTSDTITDTEVDNLTDSEVMYSNYTYNIGLTLNNLSGTMSIKAVLMQSNSPSGNLDWVGTDSATFTAESQPTHLLDGSDLFGRRYKVKLVGAGTQSTVYTAKAFFKKKN